MPVEMDYGSKYEPNGFGSDGTLVASEEVGLVKKAVNLKIEKEYSEYGQYDPRSVAGRRALEEIGIVM